MLPRSISINPFVVRGATLMLMPHAVTSCIDPRWRKIRSADVCHKETKLHPHLSWQETFEACKELLASEQLPRQVDAVVASFFVRYFLCIWPQDIESETEFGRYAAAKICEAYQLDPAQWLVRHDCSRFQSPSLVCAIPRALYDTLDVALRSADLSMRSLQPYAIRSFNLQSRRHIQASSFLYVCVEAYCTTAWSVIEQQAVAIRVLPRKEKSLTYEQMVSDLRSLQRTFGTEGVSAHFATYIDDCVGAGAAKYSFGPTVMCLPEAAILSEEWRNGLSISQLINND